ncbi:uncharacterized protein LOC132560922 [Ylistrum balloti]|uniref:uncharacterized protein LOC132560922 n=1 Tax=Ylistrum balloti TaxID=509963 RepID=UPI002905F0F8|nr:uncharacterized protein LOC132560922 [Ylistrum balloti]
MGFEQLFWSQYYKTDASLLVQQIQFASQKHIKCVEEEMKKYKKVQEAINKGATTLKKTLCRDCNNKLQHEMSSAQKSATTQNFQKKLKRLPAETRRCLQELERILIQKEKLINGREEDEQYCTSDEWCDQEVAELSARHDKATEEFQRDKQKLNKEICEYKTVIEDYNVRIKTKDRTIENKEADIKALKDRIQRLEEDIKMQDKRIRDQTGLTLSEKPSQEGKRDTEKRYGSTGLQKEELNRIREEMAKFRSDSMVAIQEKVDIEKILHQKETELKNAHSQILQMREENESLKKSFEKKTVELQGNEQRLENNLQELKQTRNDLATRKQEFGNLETDNRKLCSEIQRILQEKGKFEKALQENSNELTIERLQVDKLNNENKSLVEDLEMKTVELQGNEQRLEDNLQELKQTRNDLDEKIKEVQILHGQLEEKRHPQKKSIVLGLHCDRSGLGKPFIDMVTKELTRGVQDRLDHTNIKLAINFSQTPSEVTSWLKIVLCLNMSRIGTNILDTLKGMKGDRDVIVLVLHHTNKENLSSLTPTSHRVTGSELRQLGGILDMVFCSDSGLYECDVNSNAIDKIASFLRKYIIL